MAIPCPACGAPIELDDVLGGICPACGCLIDEATLKEQEDGREEWGSGKK
jgi:hypothetical protein